MGWLWVNSHGSFPLGVVRWSSCPPSVVASRASRRASSGGRCGGSFPASCSARWVPSGGEVLVFPLELLATPGRVAATWWSGGPPTFDTTSQRLFILQLMVTIVLLARRPSRRHALLVAAFAGAALLSLRNVAGRVARDAARDGRAGSPASGRCRADARPRVTRLVAAVAVAGLVVLTLGRFTQADLELRKYPVAPLAYLESNGVDLREVRLAAPDFVGQPRRLRLRPGAADVLRRSVRHVPRRRDGRPCGPGHGRPSDAGGARRLRDRSRTAPSGLPERPDPRPRSGLACRSCSTTSGCWPAGAAARGGRFDRRAADPALGSEPGREERAGRWPALSVVRSTSAS